jgi:membrane protein YqaA with SNARE-associated domain
MKEEKNDYYVEISEDSPTLTLPSEQEKISKQKLKQKRKKQKSVKYLSLIIIAIAIYLFYEPLLHLFYSYLAKNPTLYAFYLYIEAQITNLTYTGLYIFSILSTLFFLILPSEATFIYYLQATNHFVLFIIFFSLLGNVTGMLFNYFFGRILGEKIMLKLFKEKKFYKYKDAIDRKGGILLLLGNIFPGPIELIAVFYGGFKFSLKRYIYLVLIGRLVKYILLTVAYFFYWNQITFYYSLFISKITSIFSFMPFL